MYIQRIYKKWDIRKKSWKTYTGRQNNNEDTIKGRDIKINYDK